MSPAEIQCFIDKVFPQADNAVIEQAGLKRARVRRAVTDADLRPGGTVSGPTLMALADYAMYVALLSEIGPVELAVTTSFSIHFLRRPAPKDVIAEVELLKVGNRLAVGEIYLYSENISEPIAHATATYSIPSPGKRG
jgi:acyl-coenzyme A thioesterase PaaI-like protein